jgi:glycosyltransferase involved in cell wall biosynthesis
METQNTVLQPSEPIPVSEQHWPEGTLPIVSVTCITYNHENFIRDCLNGFLSQRTLFPIEILIHDDASTDQTANIIREYEKRYPKIIRAIYQKENQWSKGIRPNSEFNCPRVRGKYIAFCEGDDCWSHKDKLQQQLDILEKNPQIKLCFHKVLIVKENEVDKPLDQLPENLTKNLYSCEELVKTNFIPTCSVLAIRETVIDTPDWFYKLPMNDWPRWVMACKEGYAYGINDVMGVYRIHNGGVWNSLSRNIQQISNYDFYCEIEKHGPICAQAAATKARREFILKLINQEESRFSRIKNHFFFGPLLRTWERYINKRILS